MKTMNETMNARRTEARLRSERNDIIARMQRGETRPQLVLNPKTRAWTLSGVTQESSRLREINRELRSLTGEVS